MSLGQTVSQPYPATEAVQQPTDARLALPIAIIIPGPSDDGPVPLELKNNPESHTVLAPAWSIELFDCWRAPCTYVMAFACTPCRWASTMSKLHTLWSSQR